MRSRSTKANPDSTEPIRPDPKPPSAAPPVSAERKQDTRPSSDLPYAGEPQTLPDAYGAIVTSVFGVADPQELYDQILAGIKPIKASQCSTGELLECMDRAQENARLAKQLHVNMKATVEATELDNQVIVAAMRERATASLEAEKDAGTRRKAITDADVSGLAATLFPDEWRRIHDATSKAKQTLSYVENLVERCVERARDLRAILAASRGA